MAKRPTDHPHDHAKTLASVPGSYDHFLDELFRLKLIDGAQRAHVRKGLRHAAGDGALAERTIIEE